jgi:hypothetical protein
MRALATALIAALASGGCQLVLGLEEGNPAGNGDADAAIANANAALESLGVSRGELDPPFDPDVDAYTLKLPLGAEDLAVTPTAQVPDGVTIEVSEIEIPVASGTESPALALNLGHNLVEVVVTPEEGEPRSYTIAANRGAGILQQAYAKASNTDAEDQFGGSVALDGDTLAVSARSEGSAATGVGGDETNNSALRAGAVYVFVRSGTSWSQQAYIKASNTDIGDGFGASVTLGGDTLAVGANGEGSAATGVDGDETDNSVSAAGAVYVFARSGTSWSQQAYIKASNTGANDNFGVAVALDGDTLAVSAPSEGSAATGVDNDETDDTAFGAGAVYVFTRSGASWSQQAYIKASNTEAGDQFGRSVALDGDTLAVGATTEDSAASGVDNGETDNSASNAGAVYAFVRSGTSWSQQAYIKASNTDDNDFFGVAVALDGDTLAVSAPFEASNATGVDVDETDNSATSAGAVYVFTRSGTSWSQQAYIKASNTNDGDDFGRGVALDGATLAVGAGNEDSAATGVGGDEAENSASDAGAVYLFARSGTTWSQQVYIKASNTDAFDRFAGSVALDGDTLAVGAGQEDSAATGVDDDETDNSAGDAGAVYVFQ